jgi:hypothetical protein
LHGSYRTVLLIACHGGAGAVHAGLRAGTAIIVSPLMGDQVIFAKLLESKYLGAQAGSSMATVTKEGSRTQKDFGVRGFCEEQQFVKEAIVLTNSSQSNLVRGDKAYVSFTSRQ